MPYTKKFREANPELIKQRQSIINARFRKAHPKRVRKAKQKWYKENREKTLKRVAQWRKDNPENGHDAYIKRKYGLTREQYDKMSLEQQNLCGICKGPPVGKRRNGEAIRLDVDHDHKTGKIRGLLCHYCNVTLGYAREKIETLQAAILWLEKHK